jgi:hypothetical protein
MSRTAVTEILVEMGLTIQASAANSILQKLERKVSVNEHCYTSELCLTIKLGMGLLAAIDSLLFFRFNKVEGFPCPRQPHGEVLVRKLESLA